MYVRPLASMGTAQATAYAFSSSTRRWPGMTIMECELRTPVWWIFDPLSTSVPSGFRAWTCTKRSGSSCCTQFKDLSPLGSVIAPPMTAFFFWHMLTYCWNRWWYFVPCFLSMSYVVPHMELIASIPTQRWKHDPVRLPSSRCIIDCFTRSCADSATCRKRLMRTPVKPTAVAKSGSSTPIRNVSAMQFTDGHTKGWSTNSLTISPKMTTRRFLPRKVSMYCSAVLISGSPTGPSPVHRNASSGVATAAGGGVEATGAGRRLPQLPQPEGLALSPPAASGHASRARSSMSSSFDGARTCPASAASRDGRAAAGAMSMEARKEFCWVCLIVA
mmetsp:Transcript_35936/g.93511  ORF Transcript_35936/g.93511 Transcript_35936/m.93511 type:complete len:331 (+) Transcript_35936:961-1953(+)